MIELQNILNIDMLSPEQKRVVEMLDVVGIERHDQIYGKNSETRKYPQGFIEVLSFVAGARDFKDGSENANRARNWKEDVEFPNDGGFDPVVLFDLMTKVQNEVE